MTAECDPTRCPTGLAYQQVANSLAEIKKQTTDTHKVVTDQAVLLNQVISLQEDMKDLKKDNTKDHDEIFGRLRKVEISNKTKLTGREALAYLAGTLAIIGGAIGFIKAVV